MSEAINTNIGEIDKRFARIARCGITIAAILVLVLAASSESCSADDQQSVIVVVGAVGSAEYEEPFSDWADRWRAAADSAGAKYHEVGRDAGEERLDRDRLQEILRTEWTPSSAPLWLVLIGHGTFYRDVAKFNLRGSDISAAELAQWLPSNERPLIVINCASSSGPFINSLSGPGRVVIAATKSGAEQNFARFGEYLSKAIVDSAADLDHDHQVSLLEAFLSASAAVARYYEEDSRLATEHPLLDDNGDRLGTASTFFRGFRATQTAKDGKPVDGQQAHRFHLKAATDQRTLTAEQLAGRDELEQKVEQLRAKKSEMSEDEYYQSLEPLLVEIARLYAEPEPASPTP